jgi:hypothetical protein
MGTVTMRNDAPFQALRRHNRVYRGINKARQDITRKDREQLARLEDNMQRLAKSVNMGAPEGTIRHYAALVRSDAEQLGIMIRIGS